jgi:regulator of RNase E activity RraB
MNLDRSSFDAEDLPVVDELLARGDRPERVRPVLHYIVIRQAADLDALREVAEALGLSMSEASNNLVSDGVATLRQDIALSGLGPTLMRLRNLLASKGIEYDGWESPVAS